MAEYGNEVGFLPRYRVLDLADWKGVFCSKILGDLGADVIKIEPPSGDRMRSRGPFYHNEVHPEKSLYFLYYNTRKRSITLNLEHSDGRAIFKKLVKTADVVVETFPVGHLSSKGLHYQVLRELNPRLVMASITPFGQTGPLKDYKSSDLTVMAMSGYMQLVGDPDGPPLRLGNEQSHFAPSQYAAAGILAALYYRDAFSGRGQYIDISMQEAMITYCQEQRPAATWLASGENVIRQGPTWPSASPNGLYACKDGWVALSTPAPAEWEALSQWIHEVTGNEEVLDDKYKGGFIARWEYRDLMDALFLDFAGRFNAKELFEEAQRRRIVVQPVQTVADLFTDAQLSNRQFWIELDHPVVDRMKYPKGAWYCENIPAPRKAAPLLGEDNISIYCNELRYSQEDLTILRSAGVI